MDAPINPMRVGGKLLLIVVVIITPPLWWLHHTLSKGKIRTMAEQAVLQKTSNQDTSAANPAEVILAQEQGFHVAGFPVDNGKNRIWVLLDPQTEPLFKHIPKDKSFTINVKQLEQAMRFCELHPQVHAELNKRVVVEENPEVGLKENGD